MNQEELKPKVVLGVGAHPDDLDFYAAGSFAKWIAAGATAYYLILTDGSKGTEDRSLKPAHLTKARREEQEKAGQLLGLKGVFFLDYPDGELENTLQLKRDVVKIIRQVKPDVVVTLDPANLYNAELGEINHSDHRAAGQATLDAAYPLARDHLAFPDLLQVGLEPHKTKTVLLINSNSPNFAVDIGGEFEQKTQALAAHTSQMPGADELRPILQARAKTAGAPYNLAQAEAFVRIDIK